jgi:hypothetical protein
LLSKAPSRFVSFQSVIARGAPTRKAGSTLSLQEPWIQALMIPATTDPRNTTNAMRGSISSTNRRSNKRLWLTTAAQGRRLLTFVVFVWLVKGDAFAKPVWAFNLWFEGGQMRTSGAHLLEAPPHTGRASPVSRALGLDPRGEEIWWEERWCFDGMERGPVRMPVVVLLKCGRLRERETWAARKEGASRRAAWRVWKGHRDSGLPAWRSTQSAGGGGPRWWWRRIWDSPGPWRGAVGIDTYPTVPARLLELDCPRQRLGLPTPTVGVPFCHANYQKAGKGKHPPWAMQ